MDLSDFRRELQSKLEAAGERILLRIVTAPAFDHPFELSGREILAASRSIASRSAQVQANNLVLLLLPHSVELFLLHLGLILEGYCPAILPWPTRRIDAEKYRRNLVYQLRQLPASQLITTPGLADNLRGDMTYRVTGCDVPHAADHDRMFCTSQPRLQLSPALPATGALSAPADALFVQFSGGTTGLQKAVAVGPRMLQEQLSRLARMLDFSDHDGVVSWLPLYHDMGLIACLWLPLWCGAPSLQLANNDWLLAPELLFRYMDRYAGTFCWLPNFAFSYLAERRATMSGRYSLQHVRGWINCSEPVRLASLDAFAGKFADWGVQRESLQACYAMAENVFAVTQSPVGRRVRTVPRQEVSDRGSSYSDLAFHVLDRVYVSSGVALPDMQIRIVAASGEPCPDGTAGEIHIKTPSLFSGYWSNGKADDSYIGKDGFYQTGDYGFMLEDELYVIGRTKDIIINAGQNVFPEDIETVVNSLEGIYTGRVVAFGVAHEEYGTEMVAVVAEMRGEYEPARARSLEQEIRSLVLAAIGIAPRWVSVVPERWIVKSTAGKISRHDTRERFLHEQSMAS
ncbi:MAG: AMP-binding protein [Acidobacteriia bacterium]|nr:AMP-binding protein [Terriglobia bacterium]